MNADKRRLKTKNLHLSYRRPSALIGGQIAFFSSLLGIVEPTPAKARKKEKGKGDKTGSVTGVIRFDAGAFHHCRMGRGGVWNVITVDDIKRHLKILDDDYEISFGAGDLTFLRTKLRGQNIVQIEFNEIYHVGDLSEGQ